MRFILFSFFAILAIVKSSRCPESKKPHTTSCTIFYNCVNLPSGGYVWVPTKCTNGLVFQPYLRMCVLPGDTWTCDILSTESPLATNRYETPELIDPNDTSYMGSTPDSLEFSELIDSSYTTDSVPDTFNQETVTPYPLLEIEGTGNNQEKDMNNFPTIYNIKGDHIQNPKDKYSYLNRLISQLLIYKEISIPLELLASSMTVSKPPTNLVNNNQQNVLMNYLIQNYVQQNNLRTTITPGLTTIETPEINKTLVKNITEEAMLKTKNTENPLDVLIIGQNPESNVVMIQDNVGTKQYFTIEKYKLLGHQLNSQFVRLVPCIENIRLPNTSDCARYYTCEPQTPIVIEYACPQNTAFNKYTRVCDTESRNACNTNQSKEEAQFTNNGETAGNVVETKSPAKNICTELGKIKDSSSDSHYYICYSSSGTTRDIKSIRLKCPNSLIFCQNKKVCTTKRLCTRA